MIPSEAAAFLHERGAGRTPHSGATLWHHLAGVHAILQACGADRDVLRHMVSIARELGKSVIAEGVETAEQLQTVRDVGCDAAQGFLFGSPLDVPQARALLELGRISA